MKKIAGLGETHFLEHQVRAEAMGIKGLITLVHQKDKRDPKVLGANGDTQGKRLLLDMSVILEVSMSQYWNAVYEEEWRTQKNEAMDTIFYNPLVTQDRIRTFLACIRAVGLVPVVYLDGSCADTRRDHKRPSQLSRATQNLEIVNTLNTTRGEFKQEKRKPPFPPLLHRTAKELLYQENVEIVQCSEEADSRIVREAENSPFQTVFGICGFDSDFFLVSDKVQYIPVPELERVGPQGLKYRTYNRKLVEKILNIRPRGLFDIAVYIGCDYTLDLEDDILKALDKCCKTRQESTTLKSERKLGLNRLCEQLNLFPAVTDPAFLAGASPKLKSAIKLIMAQADGEDVTSGARLSEHQQLMKDAVENKKIASVIPGFLYDYIVLPSVHLRGNSFPTVHQSSATLDHAIWFLQGGFQTEVKQYLTYVDRDDGVFKICQKKKDLTKMCPALAAKVKELELKPNLPVVLQVSHILDNSGNEDATHAEKKKLFDLVRVGIRWNIFDDLDPLNDYPELKTPIAAIRYLSKMEPPFRNPKALQVLTLAVVISKYIQKIPSFVRDKVMLSDVTFAHTLQQIWSSINYLGEAVFGERNEKQLELVENVFTCPASIVANTDLILFLFRQYPKPPSEICAELELSEHQVEIEKGFGLAFGCVKSWKSVDITQK